MNIDMNKDVDMNMDMDGHEHGHRHEQKHEHRILKLTRNDILCTSDAAERENCEAGPFSNFITRNRRGERDTGTM
jgi:hypothetical protein